MVWEREKDGSWRITAITVDEGEFLDAFFAALTAWEKLKPKFFVDPDCESSTARCKE